jgi:hypothetical protein
MLVIRAYGSSIENDMTVLFFLCATSVPSVSSVVQPTLSPRAGAR